MIWPSGGTQVFTDVAARHARCGSSKAAQLEPRARPRAGSRGRRPTTPARAAPAASPPRRHLAVRAVPGAGRSRAPDLDGADALARGAARASRRCCCSGRATDPAGRAALDALGARPRRARPAPASARSPSPSTAAGCRGALRSRVGGRPAGDRRDAGARAELRAPQPPPVHEPARTCGCRPRCCSTRRAGRQGLPRRDRRGRASSRDAAAIDAATPAARLARAVPFPGTFYSPLPLRNYLPYGRELLDQGLERRRSSRSSGRRRRTRARRRCTAWARCSRRAASRPGAGGLRARARPAAGSRRGPQRSRRAARRRAAISRARSRGSGRRWRRRPTIPTRSTTWAMRCC